MELQALRNPPANPPLPSQNQHQPTPLEPVTDDPNQKPHPQQHQSQPVTNSTIASENHVAITAMFSIPETANSEAKNVENRGRAMLCGVHQRRKATIVDMGTGINHSMPPLHLTLLGSAISGSPPRVAPMVLAPTHLCYATFTLPSPPPLQPTGVQGHSSHNLVTATARYIEPTATTPPEKTAMHITSATPHSPPDFAFDPGGSLTATFPSVVYLGTTNWSPELRVPWGLESQNALQVLSPPVQAGTAPPCSVRFSPTTAAISSPAMSPSTDAASCWPWVPCCRWLLCMRGKESQAGAKLEGNQESPHVNLMGQAQFFEKTQLVNIRTPGHLLVV